MRIRHDELVEGGGVHVRSNRREAASIPTRQGVITPEYAALFGSAAKGGMRVDSDIDLLVVRSDATDTDDAAWRHDLDALASSVAAWTGNDTQILEFTASEVATARRKKSERVLRDIADDGITLFGPDRYLHRNAKER